MVKQSAQPVPTNLPTWWHRGPSGLVEEWETRVSEEEINRRQDRWKSTFGSHSNTHKSSTRKS